MANGSKMSRSTAKTNKMTVRQTTNQISLGIRPVWSESLLSAWRKLGSLSTYWAHSEDCDQTGRMPRLIWVLTRRTCNFAGFVRRWLKFYWNVSAAEGAVACSHERSYHYFTESIKSSCPFTAYPCSSADEFHKGHCLQCHTEDCSQMGYNADKFTARGSLYLETESSPSYCGVYTKKNINYQTNYRKQ